MGGGLIYLTIIHKISEYSGNEMYVKREDLIPYSFGGNKARKGKLFFADIDKGSYDCVVTYGSSHSNHCRIIANMAAARGLPCYIISPQEASKSTFNSQMMRLFEANITVVPVKLVHDTIESKIQELKDKGKRPYFIAGGGHGNFGTQAYVDCYEEIRQYEQQENIHFDYIFFASGTGTTQAGLVCGQIMHGDERMIVGISIARKNPRGRQVVIDSIRDYLTQNKIGIEDEKIQATVIFNDDYTGDGYAQKNENISKTIKEVLVKYGISLDATYTGKAYHGMEQYIERNRIRDRNILFIHTGGTPLFFDDLGDK